MSIKPQAIMLLAGWLLAAPAMALTATNDGSGSNTYMSVSYTHLTLPTSDLV